MISPRLAVSATLAALVSTAAADLQILSPGGPNLWWVASSINTLAWTCQDSQFQNFTVLVGSTTNPVLAQPQPIISIEPNFDCSQTITAQQETFPAGDGYYVQLANPLNSTQVYAQSQPFEIKPLGSAYPATSATPTESGASATASSSGSGSPSASGSGSGAAAQTSAPAKSSASGLTGSVASAVAVAAGVLGFMFA